jgi:acyl carrier protein
MKTNSEQLLELLEDVFEMDSEIMNLEDNFKDYDSWDSLTLLALIATIHDEFDVSLSNNDIEELNTIKDILDKINN